MPISGRSAHQRRLAHQRRQEEIARRARQRRQRMRLAGASIGAVLLLLVVMVIFRVAMPGDTSAEGAPAATSISAPKPAATALDRAGRGGVSALPRRLTGQPALTDGGRPLVVYIGAEYCPFCAGQRWPLVIALSRFGTFAGLRTAFSSHTDVYPDTATLSFVGSTYTSSYLSFQSVETATSEQRGGQYVALQQPTAAQAALMRTYDAAPYVDAASANAIPFLDFGNRFVMVGSTVDPAILQGLSREQIVAAVSDPASPVGRAILGGANALTAVLCRLTGGQPAAVCTSAAVRAFPELANG